MKAKAWFLKLHRWLAIAFAAPLLLIFVTGLILSSEPWLVTSGIAPGSLNAQKIQALLQKHDSNGQAQSIVYRSYDNTLTMGAGRGAGASVVVDAATGEVMSQSSGLARLLGASRQLHEHLLLHGHWPVAISTMVMLVLVILGVLMGWPRFANTVGGWHKATAWIGLPLIILSPLTGLMLVFGVTLTATAPAMGPPGQDGVAPLKLSEAVEVVGRDHDLSSLVWVRPLGRHLVARLAEDGEYRLYSVTRNGAVPMPRNWPRLWHEGNFAGAWSAAMNAVLSIALIGLLVTGLWIWLRRQLRKRASALRQAPAE